MSRIEYNPSLNDRVNGQLGDLGVEIQIPLSSIKELIVPPAPPAPVAPYKVYTALVTQTGASDSQSIDTGSLTIGVTYLIANDSPGMDFTNVGAPNNNTGTYFVATGTTPASWGSAEGEGNATLGYNTGAPTVTVLENTIGNVYFEYNDVGSYYMRSSNLFTVDKTISLNDQTRCIDNGNNLYNLKVASPGDPSQINITVLQEDFTGRNDRLTSKPIEIRVYN